jgi:hypothetical protein
VSVKVGHHPLVVYAINSFGSIDNEDQILSILREMDWRGDREHNEFTIKDTPVVLEQAGAGSCVLEIGLFEALTEKEEGKEGWVSTFKIVEAYVIKPPTELQRNNFV